MRLPIRKKALIQTERLTLKPYEVSSSDLRTIAILRERKLKLVMLCIRIIRGMAMQRKR